MFVGKIENNFRNRRNRPVLDHREVYFSMEWLDVWKKHREVIKLIEAALYGLTFNLLPFIFYHACEEYLARH